MGRMAGRTSTSSGTGITTRSVFLYAFDLLQLGVDDLRRDPLEVRKATLQSVLSNAGPGIRYNEHIEGDAEDIFRHACKLKLEGIVSKLRRSCLPLRSIAGLDQDEEPRLRCCTA